MDADAARDPLPASVPCSLTATPYPSRRSGTARPSFICSTFPRLLSIIIIKNHDHPASSLTCNDLKLSIQSPSVRYGHCLSVVPRLFVDLSLPLLHQAFLTVAYATRSTPPVSSPSTLPSTHNPPPTHHRQPHFYSLRISSALFVFGLPSTVYFVQATASILVQFLLPSMISAKSL